MASRLEEIRNERIGKLKKLVALGIAPYPAQSHKAVGNGVVVTILTSTMVKQSHLPVPASPTRARQARLVI